MTAKEKLSLVFGFVSGGIGAIQCMVLVTHSTYFGSVILRISLQRRPINVTDSSTGVNFGIGI